VIYYTVKTATKYTSVLIYKKPIELTGNSTIHTYAIAPSYTKSVEIINSYIISGGTVEPPTATPTFSVAPGTYSTQQTVTLSDSTPGALIYYTIDGTTPTTASNLYAAPITVSVQHNRQSDCGRSGLHRECRSKRGVRHCGKSGPGGLHTWDDDAAWLV